MRVTTGSHERDAHPGAFPDETSSGPPFARTLSLMTPSLIDAVTRVAKS